MNTDLSRSPKFGEYARPGRGWTRPRGQRFCPRTIYRPRTISRRRCFPRGRGKPRPGRARSPFYFGIRVYTICGWQVHFLKSEIRNPKPERNPKSESYGACKPRLNGESPSGTAWFRISGFGFRSGFGLGLWISNGAVASREWTTSLTVIRIGDFGLFPSPPSPASNWELLSGTRACRPKVRFQRHSQVSSGAQRRLGR
jgi:hypothetical protein